VWLMFAANALNVVGFSLVMEAPSVLRARHDTGDDVGRRPDLGGGRCRREERHGGGDHQRQPARGKPKGHGTNPGTVNLHTANRLTALALAR
jgi:hypothetical protein